MPLAPYIRSPLTDLTGTICTHQNHGRCADLEMRVMNCFEAYGMNRAMTKCSDVIDDFKECFTMDKQTARVMEMRRERYRQYYHGERSKKDFFAPGPKPDSFQ